jgi:uncharacterized protein
MAVSWVSVDGRGDGSVARRSLHGRPPRDEPSDGDTTGGGERFRSSFAAWSDATARFESGVTGPAFEAIARAWTSRYASADTLGGIAARVGAAVVNDSAERSRVEIDVVAIEARSDAEAGADPTLLLIGEAKSGPDPRGLANLRRLERAKELLAGRAHVERTRLAIFAAGGFTAELRNEATRRSDVELIDLERLYAGD